MSNTNHRRNFHEAKFDSSGQRSGGFETFSGMRVTMDGRAINARATVAAEQKEAIRRDRAGAKKFISSRVRFYDRMACHAIVQGAGDDE